ncbi:fimbrial protein [Xenorhabdus siamensis]|uniref:fimbrial protein n=1 Tax=Xenorhabdus siamensis TaxID=3136254 RepID=UPI0030F38047
MKTKLIISSLFVSSVFMSLAHAANGNIQDGEIRFTGKIIADACKIDSTSKNQTVNMGTISTNSFSGVNSTAAATHFSIKLTDCPKTNQYASVKFDGQLDNINNTLLALDNSKPGAADGIAVGIYEQNSNTPIPMAKTSSQKMIENQNVEMNFVAKYVATKQTIIPGTGNAIANFTIVYN